MPIEYIRVIEPERQVCEHTQERDRAACKTEGAKSYGGAIDQDDISFVR